MTDSYLWDRSNLLKRSLIDNIAFSRKGFGRTIIDRKTEGRPINLKYQRQKVITGSEMKTRRDFP